MTFKIFLTWNDDSETNFEVKLEGKEYEIMARLMWITRGSLMASSANRAVAYNEEGLYVLSYIQ